MKIDYARENCFNIGHLELTEEIVEQHVPDFYEKIDVTQETHKNSEDIEIIGSFIDDLLCDTPSKSTEKNNFSIHIDEKLHQQSSITTIQFCCRFISLLRDSHVCKSKVDDYLNLIRSILPHPNNLPSSMSKIMYLLNLEDNFFQKRTICLACKTEAVAVSTRCHCCYSILNDENSVSVFDSDIFILLETLLQNQYFTIMKFIEQIKNEIDNDSNYDIPYGTLYQKLLQ